MTKIITVVGNRPQFVKLGNTERRLREMGNDAPFTSVVVNTGQHYDMMLSDVFFSELKIAKPKYDLMLGSGHIVDQIGRMLPLLREVMEEERPDGLIVYGDTNSTLAGALTAAHLGIPVLHVEGGERLYRRADMPEEVNRVGTDHFADLCLCSSRKGERYLLREGFGPDRACFVGDPMYEIFLRTEKSVAEQARISPASYGMEDGAFILSTIHRAENADKREIALGLLEALDRAPMPVLLPAHPRLRNRLEAWGWSPSGSLRLIEPLGYFDFQHLLRKSALLVSDSGGVNREAFFAGKGCIIPLDSSAWVEAVEAGFAVTVGQDADRLAEELERFRPSGDVDAIVRHEFGEGDAAQRIIERTAAYFTGSGRQAGEGAWHPLGYYPQLPKPNGYPGLSLGDFDRNLSRLAAAGYEAAVQGDVAGVPTAGTALLLHCVESETATALEMARREAAAGFRGAFFLSVDDPDFNPFAQGHAEAIQEILSLGHELGIFVSEATTVDWPRWTVPMRSTFGAEPTALLARGKAVEGATVPSYSTDGIPGFGLWSEFADDGSFRSLGDSPEFKEGAGLALILHPVWWNGIPTAPLEAEMRVLDAKRERGLGQLRARLPFFRKAAAPARAD